MPSQRLQLASGHWYGWQMLPGYGDRFDPYVSPIRVTLVTPMKTGRGILNISFLNAFYAEGVQNFQLDLCILKHEQDYLIADLIYGDAGPTARAVVISRIEFEWIRRFCPGLWSTRTPHTDALAAGVSVSEYLDELFPN